MRKYILFFFLTCFAWTRTDAVAQVHSATSLNSNGYYGFETEVQLDVRNSIRIDDPVELRNLIKEQVTFFGGALSYNREPGMTSIRGAVVGSINSFSEEQVQILEVIPSPTTGLVNSIRYRLRGSLIVNRSGLTQLRTTLPLYVQGIYERTQTRRGNPCTSSLEPGSSWYFYHWSPRRPGCRLQEGIDFQTVQLNLQELPKLEVTPDFSPLLNGSNSIKMSFFFGQFARGALPSPFSNRDVGAIAYRTFESDLVVRGFKLVSGRYDKSIVHPQLGSINLSIRLHYSNAFPGSSAFPSFARAWTEALAQESVVAYYGHSGYGKYISPSEIEASTGVPIRLRGNQLMAVYGCNTLSYYSQSYASLREQIDAPLWWLGNGIDPQIEVRNESSISGGVRFRHLVDSFLNWSSGSATSWEKTLELMNENALLGVIRF
jgi:hypothetical protein